MIANSVTSLINRDSLVQKLYTDLRQGKIPAIVIPNFLDSAKCQKIANRVLNSETSPGCGLTEKIGESINSYVSNKLEYFKNAKVSNRHLNQIFLNNDPRETMLKEISKLTKKKIQFAKESSVSYSQGIIRCHTVGDTVHIHRDNASFDAPEFSVSKLSDQMSAVVHLQTCESGGELVIYDKFWNTNDERFRNPEFGYADDIVNRVHMSKIVARQGDLVIINSNKYHSVNIIKGKIKRITLGFFFGHEPESNFYAWS